MTLAAGAAVCWKYLLLLCCYCVYYADIQQAQWLKQLLSGLSMGPTKIWDSRPKCFRYVQIFLDKDKIDFLDCTVHKKC